MGGMGQGVYCLQRRIAALGGDCGIYERLDGKSGMVVWFSIPFSTPVENSINKLVKNHSQSSNLFRMMSSSSNRISPITEEITSDNKIYENELVDVSYTTDGSIVVNESISDPIPVPKIEMNKEQNLVNINRLGLSLISKETTNGTSQEVVTPRTAVLNGLHILVVDDSVPILKMMVKVLKQAKAIVEEAKNGQEAVDKFTNISERVFDIVITDIQVNFINVLIL